MTEGAELLLKELIGTAREQLRWQQAASAAAVREALISALTTTQMRQVYELCDGEHTFRDMSAATGAAVGTISRWTRRWREMALVFETDGRQMRRLVSLDAIGIPTEVPKE